jgi:DNA (cytosine-5)-methyltransferase 1
LARLVNRHTAHQRRLVLPLRTQVAVVKLLDLFCGEGGAASGYARAGFEITGVDTAKRHLRYYPYKSVNIDALRWLELYGNTYDAIHASPPCQAYTRGNAGRATSWPRLIAPVRELLEATGKPYVIENVADAASELRDPVKLCGCMFDLSTIDTDGEPIHLQRARLFETNFDLAAPRPCDHSDHKWVAGAYGGARRDKHEAKYVRKGGYVPRDKNVVKALLGIDHDMTWNGLFESIPPAYTEHIGLQLKAHLAVAA